MDSITSLEGPIENVDGKLVLRIPLAAGGQELIACSHGIGVIDGDYLTIIIQPWLADKLKVSTGSMISVDNRNGKFNISACEADLPAQQDDRANDPQLGSFRGVSA